MVRGAVQKKEAGGARRPDRRVIRTKTAIREALKTLLTQKRMEEITVTELACLAGVNRKTFYNYYSGVYSVMDEIEDEIAGNFRKAFENVNFQTVIRNPDEAFHRLDVWIMSDEKFYEKVSVSAVNPGFGNNRIVFVDRENLYILERNLALCVEAPQPPV